MSGNRVSPKRRQSNAFRIDGRKSPEKYRTTIYTDSNQKHLDNDKEINDKNNSNEDDDDSVSTTVLFVVAVFVALWLALHLISVITGSTVTISPLFGSPSSGGSERHPNKRGGVGGNPSSTSKTNIGVKIHIDDVGGGVDSPDEEAVATAPEAPEEDILDDGDDYEFSHVKKYKDKAHGRDVSYIVNEIKRRKMVDGNVGEYVETRREAVERGQGEMADGGCGTLSDKHGGGRRRKYHSGTQENEQFRKVQTSGKRQSYNAESPDNIDVDVDVEGDGYNSDYDKVTDAEFINSFCRGLNEEQKRRDAQAASRGDSQVTPQGDNQDSSSGGNHATPGGEDSSTTPPCGCGRRGLSSKPPESHERQHEVKQKPIMDKGLENNENDNEGSSCPDCKKKAAGDLERCGEKKSHDAVSDNRDLPNEDHNAKTPHSNQQNTDSPNTVHSETMANTEAGTPENDIGEEHKVAEDTETGDQTSTEQIRAHHMNIDVEIDISSESTSSNHGAGERQKNNPKERKEHLHNADVASPTEYHSGTGGTPENEKFRKVQTSEKMQSYNPGSPDSAALETEGESAAEIASPSSPKNGNKHIKLGKCRLLLAIFNPSCWS